jgi:hypothetical protein
MRAIEPFQRVLLKCKCVVDAPLPLFRRLVPSMIQVRKDSRHVFQEIASFDELVEVCLVEQVLRGGLAKANESQRRESCELTMSLLKPTPT